MIILPKGGKHLRARRPTHIHLNETSDLIPLFKALLNAYSFHLEKPKWIEIFLNRHANPNLTLDEIGAGYGISHERVRQIVHTVAAQLKILINGDELPKPRIVFRETDLFSYFRKELECKGDFIPVTVLATTPIVGNYCDLLYLNILSSFYGYQRCSHEGQDFYCKMDRALAIGRIEEFRHYMRSQALYVTQKQIKTRFNVSQSTLDFLLKFMPELECGRTQEGAFWRAPLKDLIHTSLGVHRLLQGAGKPLHNDVLQAELIRQGRDIITLKINYCLNSYGKEHLVKIGKTGKWALKEWGLNTDPINVLIEDCLKKAEKPLTPYEIHNKICHQRALKSLTVSHYVSIYTKKFVSYLDGTVGLRSWKLKKPVKTKRIKRVLSRVPMRDSIITKAVKILKGGKKMLLRDLWIELGKEGFKGQTVYKVLNESPVIVKEKVKGKRIKKVWLKVNALKSRKALA